MLIALSVTWCMSTRRSTRIIRRELVVLAGADLAAHGRQLPKIPKYEMKIPPSFSPSERSECCFTHFVVRRIFVNYSYDPPRLFFVTIELDVYILQSVDVRSHCAVLCSTWYCFTAVMSHRHTLYLVDVRRTRAIRVEPCLLQAWLPCCP